MTNLKTNINKGIEQAVEKIKNINGFENVKFIILYGSAAAGQRRPQSDIDLCIYYDKDKKASSQFRFRVLMELPDKMYDIHIFRQLPLYIRADVLKGKLLYCDDKNFLCETSRRTIKEFETFKHRFYDYIGEDRIS